MADPDGGGTAPKTMLFKLGSIREDRSTQFRYSNHFRTERTTGPDRLCIGVHEGQISLLWQLASTLPEPYFVLYVLHTSRCGSQLGRYESPALDFDALNAFLAEFCEFLTNDARHDLWIHSPASDATLVWDRHNLIYAYGPFEQFRAVLRDSRVKEGDVDGPPCPHVHMYHAEHDSSERKLLAYFQWLRTPLLECDEQ